jgi:hypothetical protein
MAPIAALPAFSSFGPAIKHQSSIVCFDSMASSQCVRELG